MDKKKFILIGETPPPVGGVSIHLDRLINKIKNNHPELEVIVLHPSTFTKDKGRFGMIVYFISLIRANGDLYHLHKPYKRMSVLFMLYFLALAGKKIVFTIHNEKLTDAIKNKHISIFKLYSIKLILKRFSHIVCVNQNILDALVNEGIKPSKLSVIPAFLPQHNPDISTIPVYVREFINIHSPVLIGYVWKVYNYKDNEVYGGDMMLELMHRLINSSPDIGLVMVISNQYEENIEGIKGYLKFIQKHSLENNICICTELVDLTSLFSISDIYIRPTLTDGDSVAVREAVHIGIPTIASDCTGRHDAIILHQDRDNDDLESKVSYVIDNLEDEKNKLHDIENDDYGKMVINLYKELLH